MATILPTNLLIFIMPIVLFIFIFAIFYAILGKIKIFGENKSLNSLIAFCVTILFLVIPEARQIIEIATPWFVIFVVAGLLLIMCFMILGIDEKFITEVAKDNAAVIGVVIAGTIFVFLIAFTQVFGPEVLLPPGPNETSIFAAVKRTVLNPKILGLIILMILAGEVVRRVGYKTQP